MEISERAPGSIRRTAHPWLTRRSATAKCSCWWQIDDNFRDTCSGWANSRACSQTNAGRGTLLSYTVSRVTVNCAIGPSCARRSSATTLNGRREPRRRDIEDLQQRCRARPKWTTRGTACSAENVNSPVFIDGFSSPPLPAGSTIRARYCATSALQRRFRLRRWIPAPDRSESRESYRVDSGRSHSTDVDTRAAMHGLQWPMGQGNGLQKKIRPWCSIPTCVHPPRPRQVG